MQQVWKYRLDPGDIALTMPDDAQILTVQVEQGIPVLWALVTIDRPQVPRHVRVYGTGRDIPAQPQRYVGTFQLEEVRLVFHVFELLPPPSDLMETDPAVPLTHDEVFQRPI